MITGLGAVDNLTTKMAALSVLVVLVVLSFLYKVVFQVLHSTTARRFGGRIRAVASLPNFSCH